MLVITRRKDESFIIGDDITVAVLGIKGSQVRIGIEAPKKVQIVREEIKDRFPILKKKNKKKAPVLICDN